MSLLYLLDTNILSELTRPQPNGPVVTALDLHYKECATSSTTWNEIHFGVYRLPISKRRAELERFLEGLVGLPVLPYDDKAALIHAQARVQLQATGKVMGYADGQIASVSQLHGLIVVTRNVADFQDYPGIRVENWFVA